MIYDISKSNKLTAVHSFTVFPNDLNYSGNLFGGIVLMHIDLCAAKVVRRSLYGTGADGCVTASMERVDFHKPAFLGDLITLTSEIKGLGKSSLHIRVKVTRESTTGEVENICAANLTFVAIKDKKPFKHNLNFEKLEIENEKNN